MTRGHNLALGLWVTANRELRASSTDALRTRAVKLIGDSPIIGSRLP